MKMFSIYKMKIPVCALVLVALVQSLTFSQGLDVSNGFNSKLDWKPPSLLLVRVMLTFAAASLITPCRGLIRGYHHFWVDGVDDFATNIDRFATSIYLIQAFRFSDIRD
jgi:hypothetical protein